jgi:hypothetical protein
MRRYDPRFLILLGKTQELHGIQRSDAGKQLAAADILLGKFIAENEDSLTVFGLSEITINAARRVLVFVRPFLNDASFPGTQEGFDAWKVLFIPALDHFESALSVDIEALPIFLLEDKRGYSPKILLTNIEETLPEADRGLLSDFTITNMQEAGACLAFHRFTGCGYHMARAVEDVTRRYNLAVTGHPSPYPDHNGEMRHRSLAQIAEELQDVLTNWKHQTDPRLLSLIVPTLRNFCRIYRTPWAHADPVMKELDPNDAEVAFGHGILAISTMLEDGRASGPHFQRAPTWR